MSTPVNWTIVLFGIATSYMPAKVRACERDDSIRPRMNE